MLRYLILLVCVPLLLFSAACDRFEHDFTLPEGNVTVDENFVNDLHYAFQQVSQDDISALESLYSPDYLHNGVNRSERIAWLYSLYSPTTAFEADYVGGEMIDEYNYLLNWKLKVFQDGSLVVDSTFVGERLGMENEQWLLQGNHVCIQETTKQLVIAEYFTFRTCPACPAAEAKLNQLQHQYPNFIYLEHHTTMELLVPGNDTYSYYGNNPAPSTVFQGQFLINGSNAAALASFEGVVSEQVNVDAPILYEISAVQNTGNQVSATVSLVPQISLNTTDMYLNYVLVTDEVSQTNILGNPLHNVVRAVGRTPLAGQDYQAIPITLDLSGTMPGSYKLVVFAQHRPQTFANNAIIYGGAVHAVTAKF